jgi:hypothetical protein
MNNLQALRVCPRKTEDGALTPLAKVKDLKHLCVESAGTYQNKVVQSILMNSISTLRSLTLATNAYASSFLEDWGTMASANAALAKQKHTLTALKSLTLSGLSFDEAFLTSFDSAIDVMGLRELTLGHQSRNTHLFFQHLAETATFAQKRPTSINLRSLCLEMGNHYSLELPQANFDAKCRFISSFDTLTTMELKDCNLYPAGLSINPELPNVLGQAILKHKNLKTLKISYNGISSSLKIPYLSARTVATIIDTLPRLELFQFAPQETQLVWQLPLFHMLIRIKHANK